MAEAAKRNTRLHLKRLLAECGYWSDANLVALERRKIDAYVSLGEGEGGSQQANAGPATERMARKLASARGRSRYKRRKDLVEPVFGWIKQALGFCSFLLRGIAKVRAEWQLVCLALNSKRSTGVSNPPDKP